MNKSISILLLSAVTALSGYSVPAKRVWRDVTQPDGTTLRVMTVGDEFMHFTITDDNKIVVLNEQTGQYCYGHINPFDGKLESTGIQAYSAALRPETHNSFITDLADINAEKIERLRVGKRFTRAKAQPMNKPARAAKAEAGEDNQLPQWGLGRFSSTFPRKGKINGIIILCEYSDVSFKDSQSYRGKTAKEYFTNMINQRGFSEFGGTGSALDYFLENSMGQFQPEFTVVGPVKLDRTRFYYGGNDAYGDDKNPVQMIYDACVKADEEVDFSKFDNDNDGYVDNVFVFYAGEGEASGGGTDTVWPHAWSISSGGLNLTLDGVKIDSYACSNEWESHRPDGVGTFIHEFSHVMGLPDLYCTNGSLDVTPGAWSVLDYGPYNNDGCTPPAYSIYERNAMEWITPLLLKPGEAATCEMGHILDTNEGYIVQTEREYEFFLFENRQRKGWDKFIPGHGMLIWHIDVNQRIFDSNSVNNSSNHQYVDIVEANNNAAYAYANRYSWPGTTGSTEFSSTTTPAFLSWAGKDPETPISDITEDEEGNIRFSVCGGKFIATPEVHTTQGIPEVNGSERYFIASWDPVEGADDYLLQVIGYPDETGSAEIENVGFEKSSNAASRAYELATSETYITLPAGWSGESDNEGNLIGGTSANQVGSESPSFKFREDGAWLQSKEYECDIEEVAFSYMSSAAQGSTLSLQGYLDGEWKTLWSVTETKLVGKAEPVIVDDIPAGIKTVRWIYSRVRGSMFIDDITITSGDNNVYQLPEYNRVSTAGETSVRVDKLIDGINHYEFRVMALDRLSRSAWSDYTAVHFEKAGIDNVIGDETGQQMTLVVNDRTVTVYTTMPRVDVFDSVGRHVLSVPVSDSQVTFTMPTSGFYIVRAGSASRKVSVH